MLKDDDPRGTLEEFHQKKIDPALVPSCAKRVVEEGQVIVMGCREWRRCELDGRLGPKHDNKGKTGPHYKGVLVIKAMPDKDEKKTVVTRCSMTCFHIPGFRKRIEEMGGKRGGLVKIIAHEGETIEVRGSTYKDEVVPGQGLTRIIEDKILTETVKMFPRPGSPGNMPDQQLVADEIGKELALRDRNLAGNLLGLKPEGEGGQT